jgi:heat shock protein HslJ
VRFEEGTVTGSAGCNTYSAAYAVDGPALSVKAPTVTEKMCLDPQGITEQEQRYLSDLANVTSHTVDGSQLWLEMGDGRSLVLVAR